MVLQVFTSVSEAIHFSKVLVITLKTTVCEYVSLFSVFYYLCYEGAVDLDSIDDLNQRHALEVQIMEFGQIPKQIFTVPHPQRLTGLPPLVTTNLGDCSTASSEMGMS
jgi:factor associated with neutral sphingomyelinase activation